MKKLFVFIFFISILKLYSSQEYNFIGEHLIASYYDCNHFRLEDLNNLEKALEIAAKKTKATVLESCRHEFEGGGISIVLLLSESHASIHTYPEHNACFIDIFTCGKDCVLSNFDYFLREYLQPERVISKSFWRN